MLLDSCILVYLAPVLGKGPDGEEGGWMQLLVFVVIAAVYAVGGILKSRSDKANKAEKRQDSHFAPRPAQQPRQQKTRQNSFERISNLQRKLEEKAKVRAAERENFQKSGWSGHTKPVPRPVQRQAAAPKQVLIDEEPVLVAAADEYDPSAETLVIDLSEQTKNKTPEKPSQTTALAVAEPALRLTTKEHLKLAIIHYEIFGKPIALRKPQEALWMP